MLAALALSLVMPQGPIGPAAANDPRLEFGFPSPLQDAYFAPFTDASGNPQSTAIASAGLGDLDGDGNRDAWFLAGSGPRAGELVVGLAQTAALGRFVARSAIQVGSRPSATTLRRAGVPDVVLLADPLQSAPEMLFYQPGLSDPRAGNWFVVPTLWFVGVGIRELASYDADHDGNDDLLLTLDVHNGSQVQATRFVVLHLGMGAYGHGVLATAQLDLALPGLRAQPADLDGDGRTDLAVFAEGLGVATFHDDGAGSFAPQSFLGLPAGWLKDSAVADFDADGADELALALADGVFVLRRGAPLQTLLRPPFAAPLGALAAVDIDRDGTRDLVGLPQHGGSLSLWRARPATADFSAASVMATPSGAAELGAGPGANGRATLQGDLDHDGDLDLVWQIPSGERWLALFGTTQEFSPSTLGAVTSGITSTIGFSRQLFTVSVPQDLVGAGVSELEFAVFVEDPATQELVYWTRDVAPIDPLLRTLSIPVQIMIDPLNRQWVWSQRVTRHPLTQEITAFGNTVISVHGKAGPRRFRATLATWDGHGQNGPNGSAVGVRWNIVAAPPLPKSDQQLLPWD
ncbi:MAG: VCBS repeat-containing protein [Planctomycetes bacterium]|nr:VCBS repeat-containing protein [Planctomycetota bacterium]